MDFIGVSDPVCHLYSKSNPTEMNWILTDKTEELKDGLNPDFQKSFIVTYYFEKHQPLRFSVYDVDGKDKLNHLGSVETTLGSIMGCRDQIFSAKLTSEGGKSH